MKQLIILLGLLLAACNPAEQTHNGADTAIAKATNVQSESTIKSEDSGLLVKDLAPASDSSKKPYANARFKEVTVTKIKANTYTVTGKAQTFEANFSWIVEDGHEELAKGHEMTDAGAPEWGAFKFEVSARKRWPNSTLTLVLFEISAKDGSRQHQLPIVLE